MKPMPIPIEVNVRVVQVDVYQHDGLHVMHTGGVVTAGTEETVTVQEGRPEDQAAEVLSRWGEEPAEPITLEAVIQMRVEMAINRAAHTTGWRMSEVVNEHVLAEFRKMREDGLIIDGQFEWVEEERTYRGYQGGVHYAPPQPRITVSVDVAPGARKRAFKVRPPP